MEIKFSKNWNNKLDNHFFTTIRGHTVGRLNEWRSFLGRTIDIKLKGKGLIGLAVLKSVEFVRLKDIDRRLVMLDTGMSYGQAINLFYELDEIMPHDNVIILMFERLSNASNI